MAMIRWEPVQMNRLFNSLFDTATTSAPQAQWPARRWMPATDLVEHEDRYVLRTDLPGMSEEDVSIEFDHDVLTISGERKLEHEDRTAGYYRVERSSGSFRRSVRLPEGVDADAITATFDRGVLEVTVPKPEQRMPRKVEITVGSGEPRAIETSETEAQSDGAPAAA